MAVELDIGMCIRRASIRDIWPRAVAVAPFSCMCVQCIQVSTTSEMADMCPADRSEFLIDETIVGLPAGATFASLQLLKVRNLHISDSLHSSFIFHLDLLHSPE